MQTAKNAPTVLVTVLVLMVAELTSAFESSMIYSALTTFYKEFGDPVGVGWLLTSFLLVSAAAAAICSRLGDLYGRRRILLIMLALAGIGSLISALASSLEWIIAGRAVQGVSAAILPLCYGLARELVPKMRVAFCVSMIAGTATVGAGLGFMVGGLIIDQLSWPWIFGCSAILAAVGFVLVALLLPPSPTTVGSEKLDIAGGIMFVPAISAILFGLTKGKSWGWTDGRTLACLAGGALLLAVWARYELRHKNPLIDVRLLGKRQIGLAFAAFGMVALGAMHIAQIILPLLQQPEWTGVGLGRSATVAGVLMLPAMLIGLVAAPWGGVAATRHGARYATIAGALFLCAGWMTMWLMHHSVWWVTASTIIAGFGMTVLYGAVPNLIVESAPANRVSEATGLAQVVRATSMAIGAQAVTFFMASSTVSDPLRGQGVFPSASAYSNTILYVFIMCVFVIGLACALPRKPAQVAATAGARATG